MSESTKFSPIKREKYALILDDNKSIIRMLIKILEKSGYTVDFAFDGEHLVEKFRNAQQKGKKYDFLILDLVIPGGMTGERALKEIQSLDPTVKAIVSSGYSSSPIMANFKKYGFSGVLPKPYTVDELHSIIDQVLDRPHT